MSAKEELERHFDRRGCVRWGQTWRVWTMRTDESPASPLAVLLPEAGPIPPSREPEVEKVLEREPTLFETPSFGELVGVAGDVEWDRESDRLVLCADRVFNLALLARGLAVVEPRTGAVAFDVVRVERPWPSLMRVHTRSWAILLAMTNGFYAPELVFKNGEVRRVA